MQPLEQKGHVTSWGDVMLWQGWIAGDGITLCPAVPARSCLTQEAQPPVLPAQGPAARLTLHVVLRLQLTSSPHSQPQNTEPKARRALGSHQHPPVLVEVSKSAPVG